MEFREALKKIVISNNMSFTSDNFDKTVLVAFGSYCTNNNDMLQFQELKNILAVNADFGSALAQSYLESKNSGDFSFDLLADKIEEISEELEKNNISCFSYSYFISCYLDLFKVAFKDEAFNNLNIESIAWIDPEKYDYSYQTMITSEKTFGFGRYRASIKAFKIENGVLKKYSGHTSYVVIPSFVTSIGKSAFANNKKIKSVYIPRSVSKIGAEAFSGCEKLETVVLSDSVKHLLADTFKECKLLKRINLNNITSIGKRCFMGCVKLEKIDVPMLTKVDDEAFSYCISLKNADFIASLTQIGGRAFEHCSMNYITLDRCVYLGAQAFLACKAVSRIALNSKIDTMGVAPFKECTSVNLLNIGENCYNGYVHDLFAESLEDFNLQISALSCVKKDFLKNSEFAGYNCIKEVEIRKSDIIPDKAFAGCKNLSTVKFNSEIRAIGQSAFESCEELSELDIKYVGDNISAKAFYKCKKLNVKDLLENVDSVGDFAFSYTDVSTVDFSTDLKYAKYIGAFAFANARFPRCIELDIRGCKTLPGAFHGVTEISVLHIDSLSSLYNSQMHLLFDPIVSEFVEKTKIDRVVIDGTIVERAFKNYKNIRSLEFRADNGIVPNEAFENCSSLEYVKINGNVSSIENYSFADCSELSRLDMQYESIEVGYSSFYGCKNASSLIDISKISSFGDYSFANTDISKLKLSDNVKYIGKSAFSGCTEIDEIILPFVGCAPNSVNLDTGSFGAIFGTVKVSGCNVQHIENEQKNIDYYIPKSIKSITVLSKYLNEGCFNGCSFLTEIDLPNIVDFDKTYFSECSKLKSVRLGKALKSFSARTIAGCNPNINFDIDSKCENYVSINGTVTTRDRKKLCFLAAGDNLSKYINNISSIGAYAVLRTGKKLEIPATVSEIEAYAINCAAVKSITLDSVENVKDFAFYNCDLLESAVIQNTSVTNLFSVNNKKLNILNLTFSGVTLKNISNIFPNAEDIAIDNLKLSNVSISDIEFFDKVSSVKNIEIESEIKRFFDEASDINVSYKAMCNHSYLISDLLNNELGVSSLSVNSSPIRPNEFSGIVLEKLALQNISTIHTSAFSNATVKKFTVKGVEGIEAGAFTNSHIDEASITADSYKIVDSILYRDGELIYCFNKNLQSIIIPKFVKYVYTGAIDSLNNLNELSILHSDITFENKAINNCVNLSNIELVDFQNQTLRELFDNVSSITSIKYSGKILKRKFLCCMDGVRQIQLVGVSKIDALAFYGNSSLEKVTGLSDITFVGDMAFANCSAIKTVVLSSACTRLGIAAFTQCTSLHYVSYSIDSYQHKFNIKAADIFGENINPNLKVEIIGGDIPEKYFENFDADIIVSASPKIIGDNAFKNSGLTQITLANTEKIGNSAFCSSSLQSAVVPCATYIGAGAFNKCSKLEFLELPFLGNDVNNPNTLDYFFGDLKKLRLKEIKIFAGNIVAKAFENCVSLISVFLPSGIEAIPNRCFSGCLRLENIVNIDSVKRVGERAFFSCFSLKHIELAKVEVVDDGAFSSCKGLEEFALSSSTRKIGKNILHECSSISKLKIAFTREINTLAALGNEISKSLQEVCLCGDFLGERAFENCANLEIAVLSESIKVVPSYAFADCEKLRKFECSSSITDIGKYAFFNCFALSYVGMHTALCTIGEQAFANSGLAGKYNLSGIVEIGALAFSKTKIGAIKLGDKIKTVKKYTFEGCEALAEVELTSSVKEIGANAFEACKVLSDILLDSVVDIGEKAFYKCQRLSRASLVAIERLGFSAFEGCTCLEEVTLGDDLLSIPDRSFADCENLSNVNIPKKLIYIGNRAFASTALKKVKLKMPSSLIGVGEYVFENAYSPIVYANPNQISKWNSNWDLNCKGHGLFNLSKKVTVKKI